MRRPDPLRFTALWLAILALSSAASPAAGDPASPAAAPPAPILPPLTASSLTVTARNPDAGDNPNNVFAASVTNVSNALSSKVGYTDVNGFEAVMDLRYAWNFWSVTPPYNQAKTTAFAINALTDCTGGGQCLGLGSTVHANGEGDSASHSFQCIFGGGVGPGGEGNCSVFDSNVQQPYQTLATIAPEGVLPLTRGATTLTQAVTASNGPQTVSVASTADFHVGDWVQINANQPFSQFVTWTVAKLTAVGTGTLSFDSLPLNLKSGAAITGAQVLKLSNTRSFGVGRALVDETAAPYVAGTVAIKGNLVTLSGGAWAASRVGGTVDNPGFIAFTPDTRSGGPFSATFTAFFPIRAVPTASTLTIFADDAAGSSAYRGRCVTGCAYTWRPGATMAYVGDGVRLPKGQVVLINGASFAWKAGDAVEQTITPYYDNSGLSLQQAFWTPTGTPRSMFNATNAGGVSVDSGFHCNAAGGYVGRPGWDKWPWLSCLSMQNARTGVTQISGENGYLALDLTGNGAGFESTNIAPDNKAIGLKLFGFASGIEVSGAHQDLTLYDLGAHGNSCLYVDNFGAVRAHTGVDCTPPPSDQRAVGAITAGPAEVIGAGGRVACANGHICNSRSGELTVVTGPGAAAPGLLATLAFADVRHSNPNCILSPLNPAGVHAVNSETPSTLTIHAAAALAPATVYTLDYICDGD
jgi:hypothetical protein